MKHINTLLIIIFLTATNSYLYSQVISRFEWNSNPVTQSEYGPNAISVSGSATSSPSGVAGTNGLNAGLPKLDIDLLLPSASFNGIGGIDFRIDFQRDESRGDFITCGNTFAFGIDGGELFITFEVEDNVGTTQQISINNIYAVPYDDIFRTYRFYYLPSNGYAEILVDGIVVWNYNVGNPSSLNWPNDDVMIGLLMDGNGFDKTIFDNMIIGEVYDSALPVEISLFEVERVKEKVSVKWRTESELNNDYFTIERSEDGENFKPLVTVEGAGTTNEAQSYSYTDEYPLENISYYRLVQTDFNGKSSVSDILSVQLPKRKDILIFPNLLKPEAELQIKLPFVGSEIQIVFVNNQGFKVMEKSFNSQDQLKMNAPGSSGTYVVLVYIDGQIYGSQKLIVR